MIVRALTLAGGIAAAGATSQFPEFSQQYAQRLGGAVDELTRVVADFDASASAEGLSRAQALEQMAGTAFVERRRVDMERSIARQEQLVQDLAALRGAGPFSRAYNLGRFSDRELVARTWEDFEPGVPLTFEGAVFAGAGFLAGIAAIWAAFAVLRLPFRRRKSAPAVS